MLDSDARITVVRACPGAGKTEVFVEIIRKRLREWDRSGCGLAALSFTNIARHTIEERVGGAVAAPHFVGTLDSFVFRFIVKPFGHLVGLPPGAVRLFPAAVADALEEPLIPLGNENYQRSNTYSVATHARLSASSKLSSVLWFLATSAQAPRIGMPQTR